MENLCYLELRRQNVPTYYYKNGKECDFVLYNEKKKALPLQVSYSLSDPDTYEREVSSLVYCCKKLNVKKGVVLSMTERPDETVAGVKIKFMAAVPFFLGTAKLPI